MLAELRQYFTDTYSSETGTHQYQVITTIHVDETGFKYLKTPEGDDSSYYEWVHLGTRYDRLRSLNINPENY